MKKTMCMLLSSLLFLLCLSSCQTAATGQPADQVPAGEKTAVRIGALKGPTGISFAKLMEDAETGNSANAYEFTLAGAPDELVAKISSGEVDIAAVPTNLAATLYNKTQGTVQMAAINTLGVIYILEKGESIQEVSDLSGKTVYSTGKGTVTEYVLNYILEQNGIADSVTIEYKSEHAELATLLATDDSIQIAMLPEPFVTSSQANNDSLRVALDLTEEWDAASGGESALSMGCIIVNRQFAEANKEAFDIFLDEYKVSAEYVNADPTKASALVEKFGIMPNAAIVKKAIPNCNIVFIEGAEMKESVSGLYNTLFEANPQSVGGSLPDEAFYYQR